MDVVPRDGYPGEEGFICHPVVAVGVVARHEPFITPEPVRSRPREGGAARCERFVKLAWRRSTRQTDGKAPLTCESQFADPIGGRLRKIVDARENLPIGFFVFAHGIAIYSEDRGAARGSTNRSIALAKPSSSFEAVTQAGICLDLRARIPHGDTEPAADKHRDVVSPVADHGDLIG